MRYFDMVKDGLGCLRGPLADFVESVMKKRFGDGWMYEIGKSLGECAPSYSEDVGFFKGCLTVKNLLDVITKRYDAVFFSYLGESGRFCSEQLSGWVMGIFWPQKNDLPRSRAAVILELSLRLCGYTAPGSENEKFLRALREKVNFSEEKAPTHLRGGEVTDPFEAVIIFHECLMSRELSEERCEAIRNCSSLLRGWAKNAGLGIAGTYRDSAFAEREMKVMDAVIDHRQFAHRKVPQVYYDTDDMYLFDRDPYEHMLDVAVWGAQEGWYRFLGPDYVR
ncbi:MAG: hypothetical protein LUD47_07130 [Clostridia bacterium]|nr:hypothetical protein [Clostridia bacterium]